MSGPHLARVIGVSAIGGTISSPGVSGRAVPRPLPLAGGKLMDGRQGAIWNVAAPARVYHLSMWEYGAGLHSPRGAAHGWLTGACSAYHPQSNGGGGDGP